MEFIARTPPGKALDLGCGTGTNAITLALHGWRVTGVDFVPKAILAARTKAVRGGFAIDFLVASVTDLSALSGPFDYALGIGCLHALKAEDRTRYAVNLSRLLRPQAWYMLYAWLPRPWEGGIGGHTVLTIGAPIGIPRDRILSVLHGTITMMAIPYARRCGGKGRKGRITVVLVPVACLFALSLAGLPGLARGEERKCVPTAEDAEGPFYKPGAPERLSTGSGLAVSGEVLSYPGCRPIPGASVEWWHADRSGRYLDSLRGMQKTGATGGYAFTTSPPGIYPGRPPHIHFKVSAPGRKPLTTQLYLRGGEKTIRFDLVVEDEHRNR